MSMLDVGVHDPEMRGFCDELKSVIERWNELTPSQIIAGLDTTKLAYQLFLCDVLDDF